jgi:hypothetical protein
MLSKKIRQRIVLVDDLTESLFADIDPTMLPEALGGTARLDWSVAVDRMLQDEQESNRKNSGICPLKDSPH